MRVDLWELKLDDVNVEKMHANGVSVRRALEVLDEDPQVLRNRAKDGSDLLLVGPDRHGAFVTLPIDPTDEYGVWRPRTGYPAKPADIQRYRKLRANA